MKIAISGKGGVGKTTVSAFVIQALAEQGREVLAIDADPSPHLARVLGFPDAEAIRPIAEMRELLQERSERDGPFYRLNPNVSDLPERFMRQKGRIRLMVVGAIQQGGGGCACSDNAVLRGLLNTLLLSSSEDIVLDMEAGVEHLGRGTIASVDRLLVVVQPYMGSIETAQKIARLAKDLRVSRLDLVANQVRAPEDLRYIEASVGRNPVGVFPVCDEVREAERQGRPIYEASPTFRAATIALLKALRQEE